MDPQRRPAWPPFFNAECAVAAHSRPTLGVKVMHYGITRAATNFSHAGMNDWRVKAIKTLLFFVPRANPDNERAYPEGRAWALELSNEWIPLREVGVSGSGEALFRAPNARNTGFWTDMASQKFEPTQLEPLSPEAFLSLWQAAELRNSSQ